MIVITGASKGIGKLLYDYYVNKNLEVIGLYNTTQPNILNDSYVKVDIRDYHELELRVSPIIRNKEDLVLINCAGVTYNSFIHKSDPNLWSKVIQTNLIGTYNVIRAVLPQMRENKFGRIINFSSVVAVKGTPGTSAYAASKAALSGLSKSIAVENAIHNITINNINLGYSELGMISEVPESYLDTVIQNIPMKRLCSPNEIITTVDYLIANSYLTGESLNVNGGLI
jgi:NAD(P)-dependent dehydrogenase (short-subunit alcohol dehydrogenase family)